MRILAENIKRVFEVSTGKGEGVEPIVADIVIAMQNSWELSRLEEGYSSDFIALACYEMGEVGEMVLWFIFGGMVSCVQ